MGKESLIKSTAKKTTSAKKSEEKNTKTTKRTTTARKRTTAAKKTTQTAKSKSARSSTTAKKSTTTRKPKTTRKTTTKTATRKKTTQKTTAKTARKRAKPATRKTPARKAKKPTVKELLFKRHDLWKPEVLYSPEVPDTGDVDHTPPPFISSTDEKESRRIRTILFRSFSEAELKRAAERAAADKLAAEKDEADKLASEKAKADAASDSYEPPPPAMAGDTDWNNTGRNAVIGLAAGVALIFLMIILASVSNSRNFYLEGTDKGLEIRRGTFAPMGEKSFLTLPGVKAPSPAKDVYSKEDVFPLIFHHYIGKADALMDVPGVPDFKTIKSILNTALAYGTSDELRNMAYTRINTIDLMLLTIKANVAESQGTIEALENAVDFLEEAAIIVLDDDQGSQLERRIDAIEKKIEALKKKASRKVKP